MTLSDEQRNLLESATATFQAQLGVDVAAQQYLTGRGLTPSAANTFRLGVVPADAIGWEQYAGRLAIPYLTPSGVIDIRFRALDGAEPKYMTRTGGTGHMFNVPAFQADTDLICVTEGEVDAMTVHGMCEVPCIGIAGANGWKPLWARAFADYATVVVLCDGDEPGRDFGKRVNRDLDNARVVHLPDGADANSLFCTSGADEIRRRITG